MESEDIDENVVEHLYKQEFELLKGMFEDHFTSEVIAGVLEDCAGDVNNAFDALTKIEGSGIVNRSVENPSNIESDISAGTTKECHNSKTTQTSANMSLTAHSYASASASLIPPRVIQPRRKNVMPKIDYWTEQMRKIIKDYNDGNRVMIIMRGPPGSGKSYLARVIVESTIGTKNIQNYANHIFSADDHMEINGIYSYNVNRLDEVHMKNQTKVHKAAGEGRSPIIVDNTNMKTWEMFAYARDAVSFGYILEVLEPSNPWSKNPSQLAKRNIHGVPKEKIQTMILKYEGEHTGESLIKYFKLVYPKNLVPPVTRKIPPFRERNPIEILPPEIPQYLTGLGVNQTNHIHDSNNLSSQHEDLEEVQNNHNIPEIPVCLNVSDDLPVENSNSGDNPTSRQSLLQLNQIDRNMDEILKVENEWENGDVWETPITNRETETKMSSIPPSPKPQRSKANPFTNVLEKYIEPSMLHEDWSKNLKFMTPMQDTASVLEKTSEIQVQAETTSTVVEKDDFIPDKEIPISTTKTNVTTNHNVVDQEAPITNGRCEHEEKHFIQMRKMFKNVPRPVLREIFDNCAGDVYWACSIVLDGINHNNLETVNTQESESEEEEEVDCQCQNNQARFSLMPETPNKSLLSTPEEYEAPISTPIIPKKPKKEKIVTNDSIQLKRQIEKTIMISDDHYSQHYLNMRRPRLKPDEDNKSPDDEKDNKSPDAETDSTSINNEVSNNQSITPETADLTRSISLTPVQSTSPLHYANTQLRVALVTSQDVLQDMPSTSSANTELAVPSASGLKKFEFTVDDEYDDEDYDLETLGSDDDKNDMPVKIEPKNVTLNIGMEFVRRLDELYGRHDFEYPEGVQAVMSIPTKILHDLNAIWVESITYQLDNNHNQTEEMIKQDEEFARQVELELQLELEAQEAENSQEQGEAACSVEPQKPREPNFKQIMDTELALAIYEKEVKEGWKNKEPQDMAAQMTRKKLYELFPEVANETLSEMLIAHENSFDNTVETLLMSTGQGHYLDQPHGITKFVIEKEQEHKDKLMLAEQNAALNEEEYPYLFKPGKEQTELNMDTVNQMREKAEMHKNARDTFFRKAQWYYARKKLAEASHYSRIAALHTARFDTANNYAAAALVQYHADLHPGTNVLDLHFLRVPEAENSLDLFIDDRLRKMRLAPDPRPLIIHIITGRGKHSPGRPRVKPAIMKRLKLRGLNFRQQNPGLLEARLKPTNLLLEELLNS